MTEFPRVERALRAGRGSQFTGAVARIEHGGRVAFERAYGVTRAGRLARPVYVDTAFDLASLTKVFASTLALRAVSEGTLALDDPLTPWFPEWRGRPHQAITMRMLLAHDSGMNSGADYRQLLDRNVEAYALERELVERPGKRVIYSDLGLLAVGTLLERVHTRSLSAVSHAAFARSTLRYRPKWAQRLLIPATEDDGWRGRVQGVVHDEKAYLMGGVAGHAGLFGTAADVAWLVEAYLGPLHGRENSLIPNHLAREAIREQAPDPILRRGLGWALKTSDENSVGRHFSHQTFGHTGFVGTSVWADAARDLQGVLLTNAVYHGRRDTRDLRAAFYEGLVEDLGLA